MKKLAIAISTIVALTSSTSSFARTEGSYVGLSALYSKVTHKYNIVATTNPIGETGGVLKKFDDTNLGYGLNYKYAFNKNGFFLAPEVFYENLNTVATDSSKDQVKIKSRHGLKLNFGYDIDDKLAVFANVGVAVADYQANFSNTKLGKFNGMKSSKIVGLGTSYQFSSNLTANLEYNVQKLDLGARFPGTDIDNGTLTYSGMDIYNIKTRIQTIKLGVSYGF